MFFLFQKNRSKRHHQDLGPNKIRFSNIIFPAKEPHKLDIRTAISSEEKTAIGNANKTDPFLNNGKWHGSFQGHQSIASEALALDEGRELLNLPATTPGVCSQPGPEPASEQVPVFPAVGIIRQEDEERFRMRITPKGRRKPPRSQLRKNAPQSFFKRQSALAASFSVIRANLLALGVGEEIQTLAVTSFSPGDGKTTVAINLAVIMAQEGMNTLLAVDGIKKISLSKSAGTKIGPGLTEALMGRYPLQEVIHPISDVMIQDGERIIPELKNLQIITAGTEPLDSPEGVVSGGLNNFVEKAKKAYDVIIFDTSPSLYPSEPLVLEKNVDAVLLVSREGHIPEGPEISDMQRLRRHCNVIGMVVNYVRWEGGQDFPSLVNDAKEQEVMGQMHDSKEAQKELAKIIAEEKPRSSRFLLASIIVGILAVIALWFGGILSLDKVRDFARMAANEKGPAMTKKTIKQPIKTPDPDQALQPEKPAEYPAVAAFMPAKAPVIPDKTPETATVHVENAPVKTPVDAKTTPDHSLSPTVNYPYSLHMGSFKTEKLAEKSLAILNQKGLTPYWTVVDLGNRGVWYRVFVGHFKTADAANAFQANHDISADRILKTGYAVQIGLYASEEEMNQRYSLLKKSGHCPYIIIQPQKRYQLLVGAFQTEKAATQLASVIKASGVEGKPISR